MRSSKVTLALVYAVGSQVITGTICLFDGINSLFGGPRVFGLLQVGLGNVPVEGVHSRSLEVGQKQLGNGSSRLSSDTCRSCMRV